jgi:hypothetical protein
LRPELDRLPVTATRSLGPAGDEERSRWTTDAAGCEGGAYFGYGYGLVDDARAAEEAAAVDADGAAGELAVDEERALADDGGAGVGVVAREPEGALAALGERHGAGEGAGAGERVGLPGGRVDDDAGGRDIFGEDDGGGGDAGEVEEHGLAVGVGGGGGAGGGGFPADGGFVPDVGGGGADPREVSVPDGGAGHVLAEIEARVVALHVALEREVGAVLGVLQERVVAAARDAGGGEDDQLGVGAVVGDDLLAPVAENVAVERDGVAPGIGGALKVVAGELAAAAPLVDDLAIEEFAEEIGVPP